jgi:Fur family transcriptional regulator, ferric uptake regulator
MSTAPVQSNYQAISGDAILVALAAAGLRNTKPRRLIARRIAQHAVDQTDFATEELWRQLQRDEPRLGRATLFRSVDILSDLGILDRIELGDGAVRYRVCSSGHHHHFICDRCRAIQEVTICLPDAQLAGAAASAGFSIDRHVLEVYGLCSECRGDSE